jgi:predicted nucleotidyltransferase
MRKKRKKTEDLQNMIKMLKSVLEKETSVLFCYLFGSFTAGHNISKSDVDIAVYLDKKKCPDFFEKRLELIPQISQKLKKEADIVILNTAPPFLKYVVFKEGELIFEKNRTERIDFELKATNEYFDFKPILEKYNEELLGS